MVLGRTQSTSHQGVTVTMSFDESRLRELQGALSQKVTEQKSLADSFKMEDGVVVVSQEQKTAFDKNMSDIREIKGLIAGLEELKAIDEWGAQPQTKSVAAEADAGRAV